MATAEEKLELIRAQNSARQRKFYLKYAEKLKETKRNKYKEHADVFKAQNGISLMDEYDLNLSDDEEEPSPLIDEDSMEPKAFDKNESYDTYADIIKKLNSKDTTHYSNHIKSVFKILKTVKYASAIKSATKVINLIKNAVYGKDSKPYSVNSKKAFLQSILRTITQLSLPIPKKEINAYKLAFETLKLDSMDVNTEKAETHIVLSFKEYLQKVREHFEENSKQFVMASLYNEVTVRDDFHLKLVSSLKGANKDLSEQYLIVPKVGVLTVIINQYKTIKKYGQIKQSLSVPLSKLVRQYITENELEFGDYLFGHSVHNSDFVSKMNKVIGAPGSISEFRHMKSSEFNLSNEERVLLADKMKHSPMTNLKYIRTLQ